MDVHKHSRSLLSSFLLTALTVGLVAFPGCNGNGPDDSTVPTDLVALNGHYYKGEMGSDSLEPAPELAVRDNKGGLVANQQIQLHPIEGDGELATRSVTTDASGKAAVSYTFSGDSGHAIILATAINDKDTIEVFLRANTLIPGVQGQYVRLDDLYSDVLALNGPPASVDSLGLIDVVNYEEALGVVVLCYDPNEDGHLEDNDHVRGIIVVDSVYLQPDGVTKSARYPYKTADSIGIGSSYTDDIVPLYGPADSFSYDDRPPAAWIYKYVDPRITFWCFESDQTVFQIDIMEPFDTTLFDPISVPPSALFRSIR
ncbi:MAG: hypothetical protein ABIE70_01310 [bacterium]